MPDLRSGKPLVTDTNASILDRAAEAAARATPEPLAKAVRGLSDRSVGLAVHRADDRCCCWPSTSSR